MFITKPVLGKGLSPVIIPKAVINYFLYNIPLETTIRECNDIYDFVMGQRVAKQFKVEYNNKYITRINRYYASTDGYWLYKVKEENNELKYANMLTKSGVTILNKIDDTSTADKKINYAYYISEARKIVNELKCRQLDLFT